MAFPQRWDGPSGMLSLNILLLPVGDPTAQLGGGPKFAGTAVSLVINLVSGLDALPSSGTVPDHTVPYVAQPPAVAPTLFSTLFNQLVAKGIMVTGNKLATPPPASARIRNRSPRAIPRRSPSSGHAAATSAWATASAARSGSRRPA